MEKLHIPYICARCALPFTEAENIGRWYCTWHPGKINMDNRWSCCNVPYEQKVLPVIVRGMNTIRQYILTVHYDGCDPIDHHPSSAYFDKDENPIRNMPKWIKKHVNPYPEAVQTTGLDDFCTIYRSKWSRDHAKK